MKKALTIFLCIVGMVLIIYGGLWIWVLVPSPHFEPYSGKPVAPDYWPTEGFRVSTPEDQGMDSVKLLGILQYYEEKQKKNKDYSIDSLTIYRNGYQIADFYFKPLYPRDTHHIINSCTKSVVSMLIGIAIDKEYISSLNEPFVNFFPGKETAINDERMKAITVKDLLSMKTGIRSRDAARYGWVGNFAMQHTDDWVSFILGLPIDTRAGERFDYSNMSSFLLSAIIEEATGMDTLDFARENLFEPLGIDDVRWEWSPKGYAVGFARMWLKPEDMGKLGLLYLQHGIWDGKQIIPESWVLDSITPHAYPKNYVKILDESGEVDKELTTTNWRAANIVRSFADGYGYQWWLDKDGSYSAVGVGGQYIMVVPQENLVVVATSSSSGLGVFFPRKILDKFILPAIKSDQAISANQEAYENLMTKAGPPELINTRGQLSQLPETASKISGVTYKLEKNNFNYSNFLLEFDSKLNYATFSYTAKENDKVQFTVGLDERYQFSNTDLGNFAARGNWLTQDKFELEFQQIGYSSSTKFILIYEGENITVEEIGIIGSFMYSGKMK
jgi:CubicO group peptidase (beta-lactamase class C family)